MYIHACYGIVCVILKRVYFDNINSPYLQILIVKHSHTHMALLVNHNSLLLFLAGLQILYIWV